jgi:hypothetical protein
MRIAWSSVLVDASAMAIVSLTVRLIAADIGSSARALLLLPLASPPDSQSSSSGSTVPVSCPSASSSTDSPDLFRLLALGRRERLTWDMRLVWDTFEVLEVWRERRGRWVSDRDDLVSGRYAV